MLFIMLSLIFGLPRLNVNKRFKRPGDEEIDEIVTAEAADDLAWERPIRARGPKGVNVAPPSELAVRAAFLLGCTTKAGARGT